MNCDTISKHLPDYLIGGLDKRIEEQLQAHLASCDFCSKEIESLSAIWQKLGTLPEYEPPETLKPRFKAMLEAYEAGQKQAERSPALHDLLNEWLKRWWPAQPVVQFALALVLLFTGIGVGSWFSGAKTAGDNDFAGLSQEVQSLRQLVATSLLQNQSPVERLRGVSYSYRMEQPDEQTLAVLLNTLNYDPNINVRLASVDALSNFYDKPLVRNGIIESLSRQTSPLIQIALINLLVEMQEEEAKPVLTLLQNNETFNQTVRKRAGWALDHLE